MSDGKKKSVSKVVNNRIDENLLALEDSRGNRSTEKGPRRVPSLFCSRRLRFLGQDYLERLPKPACFPRRIKPARVEEDSRVCLHCPCVFPSAQNHERPRRRAHHRFWSDSAGKVGGSRAAAESISLEAPALSKSLQSFGNDLIFCMDWPRRNSTTIRPPAL